MPKQPLKQSEILQLILAKVNQIEDRLTGHDQQFVSIDQRFQQIDQRFQQIDQRFEQIDQRFQQIDQRFKQIDQRFTQIDRRFKLIDQRFNKIDRRFDKIDKRFEQLEEFAGGQAVRLTETNELLIQTRTDMQAGFTEAKIERAAMEQRLSGRIDGVESKIKQLQDTHNEDIHVHSRLILSQNKKITRLQKIFRPA